MCRLDSFPKRFAGGTRAYRRGFVTLSYCHDELFCVMCHNQRIYPLTAHLSAFFAGPPIPDLSDNFGVQWCIPSSVGGKNSGGRKDTDLISACVHGKQQGTDYYVSQRALPPPDSKSKNEVNKSRNQVEPRTESSLFGRVEASGAALQPPKVSYEPAGLNWRYIFGFSIFLEIYACFICRVTLVRVLPAFPRVEPTKRAGSVLCRRFLVSSPKSPEFRRPLVTFFLILCVSACFQGRSRRLGCSPC